MSVDRSYSPYEVIRAYHDRGMMKWGAFATGELTEAQNTFEKEKKDDKKIQALPHHVVPVSYTHLRAHETDSYLVCRLLLEKKKKTIFCMKKKNTILYKHTDLLNNTH